MKPAATPHEIGVQYGSAVPEEIRKALNIYYKMPGLERATAIALARKYISPAQEYVPDAVEMMKGITEGAKLDFEDIFFLNIAIDVTER